MKNKREQVNHNYSKALRFVKFNKHLIYPLFFIGLLMLLGILAGDYFIGYDFFSKLAENDLGVVPPDKRVGVVLKSLLPLAVAISLKFAFLAMPKPIQQALIAILLIVVVSTLLSTGTAQVIPMAISGAERIFQNEGEIPDDLKFLFGETSETQPQVEAEELTSEAKEKISKSRFITEFDKFGRAYLLMTTAAIFTWLALAGLYRRMQSINQLKHAIIRPHETLLRKEKELNILYENRGYLKSNLRLIVRLAQDYIINVYAAGLGHPEFHLRQLKLYGSQNRSHRMFSRLQVYIFRWLRFINIEFAEETIAACHTSIENLKLVEPETFDDGKDEPITLKVLN